MGNPGLTKILFATLVVVFLTTTMFSAYVGFAGLNGAIIDPQYSAIFSTISSQQAALDGIAGSVGDQGKVKSILNLGANLVTGTVNVFVTGLEAIGAFFSMLPIIGNILSAVSIGIPALNGLIGLITTIIMVYLAMRYIQTASNKFELP
jgi:hypothetical protein